MRRGPMRSAATARFMILRPLSALLEESVERGARVAPRRRAAGATSRGVENRIGGEERALVGRGLVEHGLLDRRAAFPSRSRIELGAIAAAMERGAALGTHRLRRQRLGRPRIGAALVAADDELGGPFHQ